MREVGRVIAAPQGADELEGATLRRGLRLGAVIARGGFGTVYRARQLDVDRDVAVKLLHPWLEADSEPGLLFRDEIRAIGQLDHRNVVRIFDADRTDDGRLYFVMELLEGRTLQQVAEGGPLPRPRALGLIRQLLHGLAAVHAAGRIHADVKPSNALVVADGAAERVVLIDFGLSRLAAADRPAEAVGGTRAFMAPEQLRSWEVDARSDVYSAALVLVRLLTGWQRGPDDVTPPLDAIDDPALRAALTRALALDPADRLASAEDFVRALFGGEQDRPAPVGPPPPFRHLVPLTEADRSRLRGRDADVVQLARRLEVGRPVVFTAPSGTGKTSLLRAGLAPYLEASGIRTIYLACGAGAERALAEAIAPGSGSVRDAIAAWHERRGRRIVLVLDQLEQLLAREDHGAAFLRQVLDPDERPPGAEVVAVLGVREDHVARLLASTPLLAEGVPQVRLRPLDRAGAHAALVTPLAEHGVTIEPELLATLLDDLSAAGGELGTDLGWDLADAVYPPHLQLAGAALFDALGPTETNIELAHYRRLGGFPAIVGEYLERTLAGLSPVDRTIAREIFLSLIASGHTRAVRGEAEVLAAMAGQHGAAEVQRVLEDLRGRGLLVRRAGAADGEPTWELIHDSLVPRIEGWLAVVDLERRRLAETLRLQLRESTVGSPALLSARQLRMIDRFPGLVDELETEWARRPGASWTPRRLLQRSRQVVRQQRGLTIAVSLAIAVVTTLLAYRWLIERQRHQREAALRQEEARLRDRDLGRFVVKVAAFDWDDRAHVSVPVDVSLLPTLAWSLHEPSDSAAGFGPELAADRVLRHDVSVNGGVRTETVDARGGDAVLVIDGRGRAGQACAPSVILLRRLPGHGQRATVRRLEIRVPTCDATAAGMIEIPGGPFAAGGAGEPPVSPDQVAADELPEARIADVPGFAIDRTEITNAQFAVFGAMSEVHGAWASQYPAQLAIARGPTYPQGDIDWFDARAFCLFMGKDLPTSVEWQKALRGGLALASGPNPMPRRNLPWGAPRTPVPAAIARADRPHLPAPAGAHPDDASPYGVLDLAGGVQEWTLDATRDSATAPFLQRTRITRGGNWFDTEPAWLAAYLAVENSRSPRLRTYYQGARCAVSGMTQRPR